MKKVLPHLRMSPLQVTELGVFGSARTFSSLPPFKWKWALLKWLEGALKSFPQIEEADSEEHFVINK